jgi:hypothetical protein
MADPFGAGRGGGPGGGPGGAWGDKGGSFDEGDPFTTNLYVGNLSPDVTEQVGGGRRSGAGAQGPALRGRRSGAGAQGPALRGRRSGAGQARCLHQGCGSGAACRV